ncbi:MAG TPA: hypothetical protein VIS96_11440 [Terrimicrobiaceae bacterium]
MNSRTHEANPMLPPDAKFLAALQADNVVGHLNPDEKRNGDEKKLLLDALRFYFGPAMWWNAVGKDKGLGPLRFYFRPENWWNAVGKDKMEQDLKNPGPDLRKRGKRYDNLEQQTGLDQAYFPTPDHVNQVKLYATKRKNPCHPYHLPSYFLYEASHNLMLYVGPAFQLHRQDLTVINTLQLNEQHRPQSSYTLDFGFLDTPKEFEDHISSPKLPNNDEIRAFVAILAKLQPDNIDGPLNSSEKEMLLGALRFYFGPAQQPWNALTKDKVGDLDDLNTEARKPGGRYEILEQQTGLDQGYFARTHQATDQVKLYAATDTRTGNSDRLPSYFLYEARHNLTLYVGPDFTHGQPQRKVINTQVLNEQHAPQESHTLDFASVDLGQRDSTQSDEPGPHKLSDDIFDQLDYDEELDCDEKKMLKAALRFYFGPAQWKAVGEDNDLGPLRFYFRPEQWWQAVVKGQVKLYATKRKNPEVKPSYFLYEASHKLMLYVGPDFQHGRSELTVINTLQLNEQHRPQSSYTLDFGFMNLGPRDVSKGLDGSFLDNLQPENVVGRLNDDGDKNRDEKQMLLDALRFYFGPATKFWDAVTKDKKKPKDLDDLNTDLRKPGDRYEILEQRAGLGPGYFAGTHQATDQVKLYAAKFRENPASYVLYEARHNLTFFVGPRVINTLVLDQQHAPQESHTLNFGFMP